MLGVEITHEQLQYVIAALIASTMLLFIGYAQEIEREYTETNDKEAK